MRTMKYWLLAALAVSLVGVSVAEEKKDDKKPATIKEIMKKFHSAPKGEQKMCEKFVAGKTTDEETKDILAAYEALGKFKPPKGDEAQWKERTTMLLTAAKDIAAKKEGSQDAFAKAVACG